MPFPAWKDMVRRRGILVTDRDALRYVADNPSISYALMTTYLNCPDQSPKKYAGTGNEVLWLPYDAGQCDVRMPRQGDRMAPLGMRGTRLVSDAERIGTRFTQAPEVPVVVRRTDGEILWIPGVKRSRHDIIDSSAHEVHLITIRRSHNNQPHVNFSPYRLLILKETMPSEAGTGSISAIEFPEQQAANNEFMKARKLAASLAAVVIALGGFSQAAAQNTACYQGRTRHSRVRCLQPGQQSSRKSKIISQQTLQGSAGCEMRDILFAG